VRTGRGAGALRGFDDTRAFTGAAWAEDVAWGWFIGRLEVVFNTPLPCCAAAFNVKPKVNNPRHSARYAVFFKIINSLTPYCLIFNGGKLAGGEFGRLFKTNF
jgi:hypothetical protein